MLRWASPAQAAKATKHSFIISFLCLALFLALCCGRCVNLTLEEANRGFSRIIRFLNGSSTVFSRSGYTSPHTMHRIKHAGLPKPCGYGTYPCETEEERASAAEALREAVNAKHAAAQAAAEEDEELLVTGEEEERETTARPKWSGKYRGDLIVTFDVRVDEAAVTHFFGEGSLSVGSLEGTFVRLLTKQATLPSEDDDNQA